MTAARASSTVKLTRFIKIHSVEARGLSELQPLDNRQLLAVTFSCDHRQFTREKNPLSFTRRRWKRACQRGRGAIWFRPTYRSTRYRHCGQGSRGKRK